MNKYNAIYKLINFYLKFYQWVYIHFLILFFIFLYNKLNKRILIIFIRYNSYKALKRKC